MTTFSVIIALAPGRNAEVLDSLKEAHYDKKEIQIVIKKGLNPSKNRNLGVREAKGEILAFIDDDAIVDKDLFKNAEAFFSMHKEIDLVGGPQLTPENDGFFAKTSGLILENYFGTSSMSCRYKRCDENLNAHETFITSANCFIRRKSFLKTSGFNPGLYPGEDPELYARAKKSGFKLAYVPELVVFHKRRPSYGLFMKQFFRYGLVRLKKERINRTPLLDINPVFFIPNALAFTVIEQ